MRIALIFAVSLAVVSAACSTAVESPTTVVHEIGQSPLGQALTIADANLGLVRGSVVAGDDATLELTVFDQLRTAPGQSPLEPGTTTTLTHGKEAVFTGFHALVAIDSNGHAVLLYQLDESLRQFAREATMPRSGSTSVIAAGIDDGELSATFNVLNDLDEFTYCSTRDQELVTIDKTTGDEVAAFVDFADRYAARIQQQTMLEENLKAADDLAERRVIRDEVTDRATGAWITDIRDQVERGTPLAEVEIHRTVPVLLEPGELRWGVEGRFVIFAEESTGRLLGWVDYAGYSHGDVPQ